MEIVCWVLAGQGWRSYLRSRATPRSYEGMAEDPSDNTQNRNALMEQGNTDEYTKQWYKRSDQRHI
jgi:hypothetical protein